MTSKLSFRARALDATKYLPIYCEHEIPDNADCSFINRAVPQMPTGMEKEEETVSQDPYKIQNLGSIMLQCFGYAFGYVVIVFVCMLAMLAR